MLTVTRSWFVNPELPFGINMVGSGICNRFKEQKHGWEMLTISGKRFCLGCVYEVLGSVPIYYNGAKISEETFEQLKEKILE